ncbi:hypothetical protein NYS52_14020 [Curtobacterium flaccumfaciens pv. flaccumfaciens]|uniref:hypothetical protein n=1 Tax=Curtobacterium poinsettiae TaxID=159612 RepID=UPI00217E5B1E|nr:hypothetical protein [Curtobacterium flaccumfaciens]MCS6575649.1 hypothetical protein [Curtobacterium flaccumfaciens pv. flaccumfaciens]
MMTDEIEVVRDDEGVAIIGDPSAVERFLSSNGLASRELTLPRWSEVSSSGSMAAQAGAGLAASGRWVKLTKDSAKALKDFPAMKGSNPSVSRAVVTDGGKIKGILQFVKTPGSVLTNPAILTGAAGVMAQLAMQQAMDEITDYLAKIDAKLDDVLRAQKDQVFSDMIGVDLLLSEALTIREQVGGVNDVTWSKVQGASQTILTVQSYALRALDALAVKLEKTTKVGDLAELTSDAESAAREWLAVLARCFQLHDGLAVLELDRVLRTSPDELDSHRAGVQVARSQRRDAIAATTKRLIDRMDAAAGMSDVKVLLNPIDSRRVVEGTNRVAAGLVDFHGTLGIEHDRSTLHSKKWRDAVDDVATDARDRAFDVSADSVDVAKRLGGDAIGRAANAAGALSNRLAGLQNRMRRKAEEPADD